MSRGRLAFWGLLAATLALFLVMNLWSLPRIAAAAGDRTPFDLRFTGYDLDSARAFVAALPEAGVRFYLDVQRRLDSAFPVLLAVALMAALQRLTEGWSPRVQLYLLLCPVLGAMFDYMENAAVGRMLHAGAAGLTADLVAEASLWTVLKSGAYGVAMAALVLLLAWRGWQRLSAGGRGAE